MSAVVIEWHYKPRDFNGSPVIAPHTSGAPCLADHSEGWVCTRSKDHGGRHAARLMRGEVVAVWR